MSFLSSTSAALAALLSVSNALPTDTMTAASNPAYGITNSSSTIANQTFDYVICGGGLTGLTVASRLTENPNITVLVIEAGYEQHVDSRVNDVRTYGHAFNSTLDHALVSTPVKWQNDKELLLVAGKMLGGSGNLNGASWTKGPKSQYDLLPILTGDTSWGWDEFNKFMLKAEKFNEPTDDQRDNKGAHFDSLAHGYDGPVQVSFGSEMFDGTQEPALDASEKVWKNLTRNSDAASGFVNGATIIPNMVNPDNSQNRSSPFTAYIKDHLDERKNLHILTGHRVTEIVWKAPSNSSNDQLVAAGVQFQSSSTSPLEFVSANREVLLAAGSLQSPQILELSGVGDPKILTAAGIDVKLALRGVGKHMQEQTKNTITYLAKPGTQFNGTGPPSAISFVTTPQLLREDSEGWYNHTKATLASYASSLKKKGLVANAGATQTILQAQLENIFKAEDSAAAEVFFTIDEETNQVGVDNWNLIIMARGTAHVKSSDPWVHPVVEPSYFGHPLDLALQTAVNEQSREVLNTSPLSDYLDKELVPGTDVVPTNASTQDWERWVKESFTSVWHYIATLAMMKEEFGGVVNSRLKVYGVQNVRAIDASVLPVQLSAHLSSSLFGIAEKAAVMIKEDQE